MDGAPGAGGNTTAAATTTRAIATSFGKSSGPGLLATFGVDPLMHKRHRTKSLDPKPTPSDGREVGMRPATGLLHATHEREGNSQCGKQR